MGDRKTEDRLCVAITWRNVYNAFWSSCNSRISYKKKQRSHDIHRVTEKISAQEQRAVTEVETLVCRMPEVNFHFHKHCNQYSRCRSREILCSISRSNVQYNNWKAKFHIFASFFHPCFFSFFFFIHKHRNKPREIRQTINAKSEPARLINFSLDGIHMNIWFPNSITWRVQELIFFYIKESDHFLTKISIK